MRAVSDRADLAGAYERACSEGQAYFNDPRVYVECLVERARHIEVQIVADRHGNAVSVGERECSIQRRHQKVVEECPSPVVGPELRRRLGEAALAIVKGSGYQSVGTVEFLVDPDGAFYFLEMNTRLQVEHPVTEEVYGVDLVQEMINLALGHELSWRQQDLVARGHAIECRVYAEDPLNNFAPSPGRIALLVRPNGPGVRVDSGVFQGSVVPLDYDPMVAKLVVTAPNRPAAVARLKRALQEYQVQGIATTLTLFRALVEMDEFAEAEFHTGFLDELLASQRLAELHGRQDPEAEEAAIVAVACLATLEAGGLTKDPYAHADDSRWWNEGVRQLHGRYPR
jgi:acetyl/propionyl-CoA carboxylase alpha subunit